MNFCFVKAFCLFRSVFADSQEYVANALAVLVAIASKCIVRFTLAAILLQLSLLALIGLAPTVDALRAGEVTANSLRDFSQPGNWHVVRKYLFREHGDVQFTDGQVRLLAGAPGTGIQYRGPLKYRDNYEVKFETKRLSGKDFFCGLTFPIDKEYCTLILGGWGGRVVGLSNVNDEPAVENETAYPTTFVTNQWYRIRLRVGKEKIQVWIDDKRCIDLERAGRSFAVWWEQESLRPLGLATWETAGAVRGFRWSAIAD